MCRNSSLHREACVALAVLGAGCGRTDRNDLEQSLATTAGDTTSTSAGGSTSQGQTGSTDAAATSSAVTTTRVSAGGASSNSTGSEGLAAGGVSGGTSTEGSATGGRPATSVDVSGNWAMFNFEDPVAVSLQQDGSELSGTGCCGGLDPDFDFCCAPIAGGSVEGRHVQFGFPVDSSGVYRADVFVSEDGERMAGPFHHLRGWGDPTAWVRIADGEAWLPRANVELADQLSPYAGSFTLALTHAEPVGTFAPNTDYALGLVAANRAFVLGELGSFWEGELSWDGSSETLLAGPVPETHPDLPIELRLSFASTELLEVVATLPSGEAATFSVNRN